MTSESTRFFGQPSETKPTVGRLVSGSDAGMSSVGLRLTLSSLAGDPPLPLLSLFRSQLVWNELVTM